VIAATQGLLKKLSLEIKDFDHVVFHMPNAKFPLGVAQKLGVPKEKLALGLVVPRVGNSYSGSSMVGLCAVLDKCEPGQRILMTSFGSGAGSDSFSFVVNDRILKMRDKAKKTEDYIKNKEYVDYGTYVKMRKKLKV
jgi:hydroxymethylglutaryl-CoA synthase